jgi:Immunity protein 72
MNYEQKQREAFYLIKKYSSFTWYAEIYRLWKAFCEGYERDFYRFPIREPADSGSRTAGELYEPGAWDEQNLKMFWGYAANLEEGLALLQAGSKPLAHARIDDGTRFNEWLYSRRFTEIDLTDMGYTKSMADVSKGIFAYAQKANLMRKDGIRRHVDALREDYLFLPDKWPAIYAETARLLKIPVGVPAGELLPLPKLDLSNPTVISGDEVPSMGIWIVEPDDAHLGQTYCMAYLVPWAPAIETVSEQEYEINSRWIRTDDESFHEDSDKIKDYPVRWRLLWRDDRDYSEGKVPPEEVDYLNFRQPTNIPVKPTEQLRCEAGQPCPREGLWFSPAIMNSERRFQQGEVMPSLGGDYGLTIWQWSNGQ